MSPNRLVLVTLLGVALSSAACNGNDSSPLEPGAQLPAYSEWQGSSKGHDWGEHKPTSCKPLSPRSDSKDIGPLGGTLQIGPHTLTVLPGALLQKTRITGTITADTVNSIRFTPEGLHFVVPAVLSLSYANCRQPTLASMKVVYTSDDLFVLLELIRSQDLKARKTVLGLISHFSRYAVAY